MKLAILGHSPIALEAAVRFHLHGAAFTWFMHDEDIVHFDSQATGPMAFTSDLGMSLLKEIAKSYHPQNFSWKDWRNNYQKPLIEYLKAHQEIKEEEIVSVTKRFLAPGEVIPGKSRFFDLFRIIYKVNPKEFIEDQKETNPETYQRLTEEFVHSLASTIEMYQDYDVILDFRNNLSKASASRAGRALGEGRRTEKVLYAMAALKTSKNIIPTPEIREIALVGSDSLGAEILLSLEAWIKETKSRLFIISTEEDPFADFLKVADEGTKARMLNLFSHLEKEFQQEIEIFTQKLREWLELDDFVQVKIPKPVEPIPRLVYFSGHNVTAIDELIDRKRMFLTLEKPEFRDGKKHPENNHLDLKTVGVDQILIAHAKKDLSILEVDSAEAGFFSVTPTRPNIRDGWEHDLSELQGIEDEIFKLFSPHDSH